MNIHMNIKQIEKAIQLDQAALNELFHTYYPHAMKKALTFTHNYADAEDVVQETFLQLYQSINTLCDSSSFIPWLNKIIHSKCIKLYHKNRHSYAVDPDQINRYSDYEETRVYMLPKQAMKLQTEKEMLYHCIRSLKHTEQAVMILTYIYDLKLEEAAQQLHIPLGTVKTRRYKAKQHMKHYLTHTDYYPYL